MTDPAYEPSRTPLGAQLRAARARYIESGEPLLDDADFTPVGGWTCSACGRPWEPWWKGMRRLCSWCNSPRWPEWLLKWMRG